MPRRSGQAAAAALGLLCALACAPAPPSVPEGALSLLAVGDTGRPAHKDEEQTRQRVGEAMAREDRRAAVDGVLLLGDNFYPDGLEARELVKRVRENVVEPFCHFLRLDGPRSADVRDACAVAPAARRPVPLWVLLGNHDYVAEESPRLQREAVPRYVPNWEVAPELVRVVPLAPDLSLVLVDSMRIFREPERAGELAAALRAAPGPWRIVAAHHPVLSAPEDADDFAAMRRFVDAVAAALREVEDGPQLWVSGHEHSLQLLRGREGEPPLQVISGTGSQPREVDAHGGRSLFGSAEAGFVRIDRLPPDGARPERLRVSVFLAGDSLASGAAVPVAEASVDVEGRVEAGSRASAAEAFLRRHLGG